ncbi:hypothetical protein AFK66_021955 [Cronobacter malonaticus LMG 23826]|nr:hypothetical protein AFK66_021955 [Cronobacter malonaticus LMG 23826]
MMKSNATYAAKVLLRLQFTAEMAMKSCATNVITTFTTLMMRPLNISRYPIADSWSRLSDAIRIITKTGDEDLFWLLEKPSSSPEVVRPLRRAFFRLEEI